MLILFLLVVRANVVPNNTLLEIDKELQKSEKFLEAI